MDNNLDTTGGVVPPTVIVDPLVLPIDPPVVVPVDPIPIHVQLTALQHVEAWWAELKASMPRPDLKSFDTHAAEQWHKLVARLKGL